MKLTAICSYEKEKNLLIVREDYKTKTEFKRDLEVNGYRNIRIYSEEDFDVMGKGIYKTARSKKINEKI